MTPFTQCECGSIRFLAGPRGGMAQNITCCGCERRYNVIMPMWPGRPVMLLEELTRTPDYHAAPYIIELMPIP